MESTTMKKTYIIPNVEVVKIATQQMLAVSNPSIENEVAEKSGDYYNDSRYFDFDDEEDW